VRGYGRRRWRCWRRESHPSLSEAGCLPQLPAIYALVCGLGAAQEVIPEQELGWAPQELASEKYATGRFMRGGKVRGRARLSELSLPFGGLAWASAQRVEQATLSCVRVAAELAVAAPRRMVLAGWPSWVAASHPRWPAATSNCQSSAP